MTYVDPQGLPPERVAHGLERIGFGIAVLHAGVDRVVDLCVDAADEEVGDAGDPVDRLAS